MKKVLCFLSVLVAFVFMLSNVSAVSIVEAGETVNQVGEYDSTRFVAGNTVTNKASVDGLSFIAGNELNLSGSTPYGFYAGNIVVINENVKKDMFVAGNNITIGTDAIVGRDAYIAGNVITINTNIARDLRVAGSKVDLSGITVGGDAFIDAEEIIMDENTIIAGKLTYSENTDIAGLNVSNVGSVEVTEYEKVVVEYNFVDRVRDFIISSVSAFIVMVVLFYLIPSSRMQLDNTLLTPGNIFKHIGIGFALLVGIPMIMIIALFTGVLTPLALITLVLYIISIYLSSLLVYYIVGKILNDKFFKNDNVYISLVIGIICVKLIKYIPVIGGLVGAFSLFYGLGLILKFILKNKNQA